ncbi:protein LDOC1-like [Pantherophis guttatus]|uniref:Protein LDOC1-like n=1 Tax=Pantherophis guttatus TaxID=94885 RepID=A0A6P9BAM3_PANGU|nr:protein LDOC1-like [Pantherophis guttatus]XP_060545575.1 protein LDOC1-like [Pantherophis guttatus]
MKQLHAKNAQLQQQVALLVAQMAQLQVRVSPPPRRKGHVAMSDKFDGTQAMFPVFMGQCQLFISLRMEYFSTDRDKVGFVLSLLSGSAVRWTTPLVVQASPLLDNFRLMYEDPIKMQTAIR